MFPGLRFRAVAFASLTVSSLLPFAGMGQSPLCRWGGPDYSWVADFDGDGTTDIASANGAEFYLRLSRGDRFRNRAWTVPGNWGGAGYTWAADFNGDGKADIASFARRVRRLRRFAVRANGEFYMHLSNGAGFDNQTWTVPDAWGSPGYTWVADFDGDGAADIASANGGNVYIHLARDGGFDNQTWTVPGAWGGPDYSWAGDFNGDGRADIVSANSGDVYLHLSNGSGFDSQTWSVPNAWGGSGYTWVADFNGDGRDDVASANAGNVYVHLSQDGGFDNQTWTVPNAWGGPGYTWVGDFNGDGIADIASADGCSVYLHFSTGDRFRNETWYSGPDRPDKEVLSVALQADGKVLIGGFFTSIGERPRVGMARLNRDGSLDTSFDASLNSNVRAIVVQPDGKILAGGEYNSAGGRERHGIARFDADGSLDTAFDPRPDGQNVYAIALQPDGKILLGGVFTWVGGERQVTPQGNTFIFGGTGEAHTGVARFLQDGTPDAVLNPILRWNPVYLVLGPDRDLVLGRSFDPRHVGPYYRSGPYGITVLSIAFQPDGKILIGGHFTEVNRKPRDRIARLNPDAPIAALGPIGGQRIDPEEFGVIQEVFDRAIEESLDTFDPKVNAPVTSIVVQPDGKIIIGGPFNSVGGHQRVGIARLNPDGSLDTSFDPRASSAVNTIALQADGKILIGGTFDSVGGQPRVGVARLNADGSLDQGFDPKLNSRVNSIVADSEGRIVIGGEFTSAGGRPCYRIALLNPDGSLDSDF